MAGEDPGLPFDSVVIKLNPCLDAEGNLALNGVDINAFLRDWDDLAVSSIVDAIQRQKAMHTAIVRAEEANDKLGGAKKGRPSVEPSPAPPAPPAPPGPPGPGPSTMTPAQRLASMQRFRASITKDSSYDQIRQVLSEMDGIHRRIVADDKDPDSDVRVQARILLNEVSALADSAKRTLESNKAALEAQRAEAAASELNAADAELLKEIELRIKRVDTTPMTVAQLESERTSILELASRASNKSPTSKFQLYVERATQELGRKIDSVKAAEQAKGEAEEQLALQIEREDRDEVFQDRINAAVAMVSASSSLDDIKTAVTTLANLVTEITASHKQDTGLSKEEAKRMRDIRRTATRKFTEIQVTLSIYERKLAKKTMNRNWMIGCGVLMTMAGGILAGAGPMAVNRIGPGTLFPSAQLQVETQCSGIKYTVGYRSAECTAALANVMGLMSNAEFASMSTGGALAASGAGLAFRGFFTDVEDPSLTPESLHLKLVTSLTEIGDTMAESIRVLHESRVESSRRVVDAILAQARSQAQAPGILQTIGTVAAATAKGAATGAQFGPQGVVLGAKLGAGAGAIEAAAAQNDSAAEAANAYANALTGRKDPAPKPVGPQVHEALNAATTTVLSVAGPRLVEESKVGISKDVSNLTTLTAEVQNTLPRLPDVMKSEFTPRLESITRKTAGLTESLRAAKGVSDITKLETDVLIARNELAAIQSAVAAILARPRASAAANAAASASALPVSNESEDLSPDIPFTVTRGGGAGDISEEDQLMIDVLMLNGTSLPVLMSVKERLGTKTSSAPEPTAAPPTGARRRTYRKRKTGRRSTRAQL